MNKSVARQQSATSREVLPQEDLQPEIIAALMDVEEQGVALGSSPEDFCKHLLRDEADEDVISIRQVPITCSSTAY